MTLYRKARVLVGDFHLNVAVPPESMRALFGVLSVAGT
jgi:hypothetical protein